MIVVEPVLVTVEAPKTAKLCAEPRIGVANAEEAHRNPANDMAIAGTPRARKADEHPCSRAVLERIISLSDCLAITVPPASDRPRRTANRMMTLGDPGCVSLSNIDHFARVPFTFAARAGCVEYAPGGTISSATQPNCANLIMGRPR